MFRLCQNLPSSFMFIDFDFYICIIIILCIRRFTIYAMDFFGSTLILSNCFCGRIWNEQYRTFDVTSSGRVPSTERY